MDEFIEMEDFDDYLGAIALVFMTKPICFTCLTPNTCQWRNRKKSLNYNDREFRAFMCNACGLHSYKRSHECNNCGLNLTPGVFEGKNRYYYCKFCIMMEIK